MYTPMDESLKNVSLSESTMRPEDLIPCFISALRIIESDNKGIMESMQQMENDTQKDGYFESEDCQFDLNYLFDLLDACSPDGFYFGAHPGNGSDYGFWKSEDQE